MSKDLLQSNKVEKIYNDAARDVAAVRGVDLTVVQGESLAIVGPSGAGKSTLLHMIGGLDRPTKGEVLYLGDDLYKKKDFQISKIRNEEFGFIFQFYHLLPELNALENVILPAMVQKNLRNAKALQAHGLKLLEMVGLVERFDHKPNQLSGGEQQRVAIARSLMNDPKIIFCDEPTGNLDSQSGQVVIDLLLKLNKEKQQTIVMITHDLNIADRMGRKILMKDGFIV